MTVIFPGSDIRSRGREGVAGVQDEIFVDVVIEAEADFDHVVIRFRVTAFEAIEDVVGTEIAGEAIGETLLHAHPGPEGSPVLVVTDVGILKTVTAIPADIGLFGDAVGEAGFRVGVGVAATVVPVAHFSTRPETPRGAAAEGMVDPTQEILGSVVSKSVVIFGYAIPVGQNSGGEFGERIAEILCEEVADVVFTGVGVRIIINPGQGVAGYGGEPLGPGIGYIQAVVSVDVGLGAAGHRSPDLVVWLILVSKVEIVGDGQTRVDAVTHGKIDTGALLELIDTFRSIKVIKRVVSEPKGIGSAAVAGAVFGNNSAFDKGAVLLIVRAEVHIGIPASTQAYRNGKGQLFLKLVSLTKAEEPLSMGTGAEDGERGEREQAKLSFHGSLVKKFNSAGEGAVNTEVPNKSHIVPVPEAAFKVIIPKTVRFIREYGG